MPRVLSDLIPRSKSCPIKPVSGLVGLLGIFLLTGNPVLANIPGGGTGTGPNVTLTDNGTTVTLANGIVSIVITKTSAEIHTINYCYNNSGSMATNQLLSGGNNGGLLYWFQNGGTFIAGPFTQSVVANDTNYAEISLSYASPTNGVMDICAVRLVFTRRPSSPTAVRTGSPILSCARIFMPVRSSTG